MLFLVRHAKAGQRFDQDPNDDQRPLSPAGWTQANALAAALVDAGATGPVLSSPFLRCAQTLQPLADRLGLMVQTDGRLAEAKPFLPAIELMTQLPDGAVLCSHGDLIPDVIDALARRGCAIDTEPNWKKGSVWLLRRDGKRAFFSASAWPPPKN